MPACARKEIIRQGLPGSFVARIAACGERFCWEKTHSPEKDHNHRRAWVLERIKLSVASVVIDVGFKGLQGCDE